MFGPYNVTAFGTTCVKINKDLRTLSTAKV